MKKTTLMMIASATMLLAAPGTDMPAMQGQGKGMHKMHGHAMMMKKRMAKKKMNSPFLIKHGLPHLTKMVMPYLDDPSFNLTAEQKEKLAKIREETMGTLMKIKPEVRKLRKEIVQASTSGTKAADLKEKVDKLASLEAEATMTHLKCIESTKAVLTKDQLLFLLSNKNKMKKHGMKKGMGQGKMKMMKNGAGKCANAK
jgi:Spy/CpxP family protein refolding chaperone